MATPERGSGPVQLDTDNDGKMRKDTGIKKPGDRGSQVRGRKRHQAERGRLPTPRQGLPERDREQVSWLTETASSSHLCRWMDSG
jgi:hypothetical protein